MVDDRIKEAFQKVKEDMGLLREQLDSITSEITNLKRTLTKTDTPTDTQTDRLFVQTQAPSTQTHTQTNQTDTEIGPDQMPPNGSKRQNLNISTGNRGVQTDRQTNQQTDRQTDNYPYKSASEQFSTQTHQKFALNQTFDDPITRIEKVAQVINSLDALKRDLRKQFKLLTSQEMLVFSTIYQLTDQAFDVDYSLLSKKTSLSESSIRDYVQKIIKKGIPLEKTRENNKRILLTIPPEFKRMASLETINTLRNL
ncbi:MAG: hypothetical protein ABH864_06635 [archaeon]